MKEKDFGIESSTDKREARLRGLRKFAAAGSIAVAAFGLGACGDNASAESGEQSGQSGISAEGTVCNTETGVIVTKQDGMDPSIYKESSACATITPEPVNTETATPEPSENESSETDSSWVGPEFLQKITVDYDSFSDWDSKDKADKLDTCMMLLSNNGVGALSFEDQSKNTSHKDVTDLTYYNSMSGQEIVDYWNKQNAIVWSLVNDRTDKRNGDIAKYLSWCITSNEFDSTEYGTQESTEETLNFSMENITDPQAAPFIFGRVTQQSPQYYMATGNNDGGIDEYAIEAEITRPSAFGDGSTEVQAVFKLQWMNSGPLWQLVAQKNIEDDKSSISSDVANNLEPVK